MFQAERMEQQPEVGAAVAQVIASITMYARGITLPFTIVVDDPSGNSFVENPSAPSTDPQLVQTHYTRSPKQDLMIGLQPSQHAAEAEGGLDDTNAAHRALPGESYTGIDAMLAKFGAEETTEVEVGEKPVKSGWVSDATKAQLALEEQQIEVSGSVVV